MVNRLINNLSLILVALFLMVSQDMSSADVGPSDLQGEDKEHYDRFRDLFLNGEPDDFYSFAKDYEVELKGKGYKMLYYKLKNNEGFYALRHKMILRAMKIAEDLDAELRKLGDSKFFYLGTGLMGDIYSVTHNRTRAEQYFTQALAEVDDRDPKFSMRIYQSLAEMMCIKDSKKSLDWMAKSYELSKNIGNVEYEGLTLAMTAYLHFLDGNSVEFFRSFDAYNSLRSMENPEFNHRYDNVIEVAKSCFDGNYQQAFEKLKQGNLAVDSSLVAIRIYALAHDVEGGFNAMKNRYLEMDSIYGIVQDVNYDQMASESNIMRKQQEADANKKLAVRLTYWFIALTVLFVFSYIMGRKRLFMKLREKSEQLKDALAHAEESDRMKTAFINNMSHEIRTPLNAVAGFSRLLCQPGIELGEDEKKDMQERITNNVELITSIVGEVLELSKSESESRLRPESDMEDAMINAMCRRLLRSTISKAHEGVETRFATNVADDFVVRTHPATVNRILTHLLSNAQKFTDQGYIELRCTYDNSVGKLYLSMTDTGVGIKKEDQKRIFELFEKADENFKEGVGLGLPICRRLATSIGGEVTLDTSYTGGSRFVLTIPCTTSSTHLANG